MKRLRGIEKHRHRKYGLEPVMTELIYQNQGGLCALCNLPMSFEECQVDHCHKTGKVRGLIHRKCNVLLGMCDDHTYILRMAIKYLEKFTKF